MTTGGPDYGYGQQPGYGQPAYGQPDPLNPTTGWPGAYAGYPGASPHFDQNDPMISGEYSGWWSRSIELVKRTWQQMLLLQVAVVVLNLVVAAPAGLFSL